MLYELQLRVFTGKQGRGLTFTAENPEKEEKEENNQIIHRRISDKQHFLFEMKEIKSELEPSPDVCVALDQTGLTFRVPRATGQLRLHQQPGVS